MEAAQGLPDPVDHPTSPELRALLATLLPACIMMDAVYENVTVCLPVQSPTLSLTMHDAGCLPCSCRHTRLWANGVRLPGHLCYVCQAESM